MLVGTFFVALLSQDPPDATAERERERESGKGQNPWIDLPQALTYSAWWRAGNPIFFFFGGEGSVEGFYNASGAVFEHGQAGYFRKMGEILA